MVTQTIVEIKTEITERLFFKLFGATDSHQPKVIGYLGLSPLWNISGWWWAALRPMQPKTKPPKRMM